MAHQEDSQVGAMLALVTGILIGFALWKLFGWRWYWCAGAGFLGAGFLNWLFSRRKAKQTSQPTSNLDVSDILWNMQRTGEFRAEDFLRGPETGVFQALTQAFSLQQEAVRLYKAGRYAIARAKIQEAIKVFETTDQRVEGKALCLQTLGDFCQASGELETALRYYGDALSLLRPAREQALAEVGSDDVSKQLVARTRMEGLSKLMGGTLIKIGISQRELGRRREALNSFQEGLTISRDVDLGQVASALAQIGRTLVDLGRLDEAASHYRESLEIREQLGDAEGAQMCRESLRAISREKSHFSLL